MTYGTRRVQRTTVPTKVPGIPKPPANIPVPLQRYLTNLSEAVEIRLGRKGDTRDRAITLRELIDSGLALDLAQNPFDPNNPGNDFDPNPVPGGDADTPTAPTNFQASGAFSIVGLFWDYPNNQYRGHSFTELFRSTQNNLTLALAAGPIGVSPGIAYTDFLTSVTTNTTYYYWARHVNVRDVRGPFHGTSGVAVTLTPRPDYLLSVLTDQIDKSQLVQTLRDEVNLIDPIKVFTGYTSSYTGNSLITRMGAVENTANSNATVVSNLSTTVTGLGNDVTANTSNITTLQANVNTNAAAIQTEQTARASADATLAADITTVQTQQGTNTAAIQTNATAVNGLEAQYTVKIQTNSAGGTYISGYGLASTVVNGQNVSSFVVAADRFAVINPTTYSTGQQAGSLGNTFTPFVVQSTASTVTLSDGQVITIPAGVHISSAFITKASILQLIAGSVTANFVLANSFVRSPNIHGGTFNIGTFSNNGSTDPSNWTISGSNRVSNFSVDANGIMHANAAKLTALTIFPTVTDLNNGTNVIFDSNGLSGTFIKDATITAAKIENATITTAKIATADVDTLLLAGNAVTIPVGGSGGSVSLGSSTNLISRTITYSATATDPDGNTISTVPSAVIVTGHAGVNIAAMQNGTITLSISNGSTTIGSASANTPGQKTLAVTAVDTPPSGSTSRTYTLTISRSGNSSGSPTVTSSGMTVIGAKR